MPPRSRRPQLPHVYPGSARFADEMHVPAGGTRGSDFGVGSSHEGWPIPSTRQSPRDFRTRHQITLFSERVASARVRIEPASVTSTERMKRRKAPGPLSSYWRRADRFPWPSPGPSEPSQVDNTVLSLLQRQLAEVGQTSANFGRRQVAAVSLRMIHRCVLQESRTASGRCNLCR